MRGLLFLLGFSGLIAPQPLAAQNNPVTLSLCEVDTASRTMTCNVENTAGSAIAGLRYDLRLMEGDRSVPWGVSRGDFQVPGGIEPGETKRLNFQTQGLPAEGWSQELHPEGVLEVLPWGIGADQTPANPGPPMTGPEKAAFRAAIQGCWVVDPGAQSAGVTITIVFELDRQGRVVSGPDLLTSSGGSAGEINAAFESARRAVNRCGRDGFDLPVDKFEQWRVVELTFDFSGIRIR